MLFAAASLVFFLVHLVPGDPVSGILGQGAAKEDVARLKQELNLHKPLVHQYIDFMKNLFNLGFGKSLFNHRPVLTEILIYFPNTLYLALVSLVTALLISFPLGAWGAFQGRSSEKADVSVTLLSSLGLAVPNFVLGPLLIIIFSVKLDWLPVSGSDGFAHIVLPALTLGTSVSAYMTRMIRASVAMELNQPYILLARAKGPGDWRILWRHLLKNAMIPVVTAMGLQLGALLAGTIITETVFSWQGIGNLLVTSIQRRDYPMVQGVIVFITAIYLVLNFAVDLSYIALDPLQRRRVVTDD